MGDHEMIASPNNQALYTFGNGNGHRIVHIGMGHPDSPRKPACNQGIGHDRKLKEILT